MAVNLMMSAKFVTPSFLKIKTILNESYDVVISVHYVTNKILSGDSIYLVDVVMWPNFGNSGISMKEAVINFI